MQETEPNSAIRRKLSAPAGPFDTPGTSLAKTMRLAVVRALDDMIGLEVGVTQFSTTKSGLKQVADQIGESDLIFKTCGPQQALGIIILDAALVSGWIEHMITGRVAPDTGNLRHPSTTDAAVVSGLINDIITKFENGITQVNNPPPISGYRTAGTLEDARTVSLVLDDVEYRTITMEIELSAGIKTGALRLIFPRSRPQNDGATASEQRSWAYKWRSAVEKTNVEVEALLLRLSMSLEQISNLQIGDLVPVPVAAVGNVSIIGRDGKQVGHGRLGQSGGARAVRIEIRTPFPVAPALEPAKATGVADMPDFETATVYQAAHDTALASAQQEASQLPEPSPLPEQA